jgi:hypothetical protein
MKTKLYLETERFQKWVNKYLRSVKRDRVPLALQHITIDLLTRIIMKNPVDTGRSRAGWYAYLDKKNVSHSSPGKNGKAINEGRSKGNFVERFDILKPYIEIRNGVVYVKYLEYGSSGRSPYGMVRISMTEIRREVTRKLLKQLTKESIYFSR